MSWIIYTVLFPGLAYFAHCFRDAQISGRSRDYAASICALFLIPCVLSLVGGVWEYERSGLGLSRRERSHSQTQLFSASQILRYKGSAVGAEIRPPLAPKGAEGGGLANPRFPIYRDSS